ncbi:MAG: V-type ATP synthase subunit I [Spirochaetota bacterium]
MIATMKKAYLVALESKRTQTLQQLRDIGVLHLEEIHGQSEELDDLYKKRAMLERAKFTLPAEEESSAKHAEDKGISHKEIEEALEIAKRVEQQQEQKSSHREAVDKLEREMERIEPLGDFDPKDVLALREKGVNLHLLLVSKEKRSKFPDDITQFEVFTEKSRSIIAALVNDDSELFEQFPRFELPELSYTEMKQEQERHTKAIERINKEMQKLVKYHQLLQKAIDRFDQDIEFEQVRSGLNEEDELVYLGGFVPEQRIEKLKKGASEHGWALLIREPTPEETIPTMVVNPKPIRIIKPVFNFLGTVPGYFEYDISFYLLFFLTIFFAMIIGDAGYGTILLGTTIYTVVKKKKAGEELSEIQKLMMVFGGATVIWGALSGVWFGSQFIAQLPFFSWLTFEPISGFGGEASQQTIKHICFVLGTIQLSIAHIWNFMYRWKDNNRLKAISELGWLSMVLGLYYVVLYLVLDPQKYPIPQFSLYMIFIGLGLVLFLSEQEGNFIKGALKGVANFMPKALDSISAFSDIISYIRLFAVGLATVEIAKSFNSMAAELGSSVVGIIGGIVILLIGHGLNMAMAALSVIVHGVRLNLLEFSGHLNMEWTGIPYDPFRNRQEK